MLDQLGARLIGLGFASLRTAIQGVLAGVVVWLASLGINITDEQTTVISVVLWGVVLGLVTLFIRWLETIRGDKWWQVWSRRLAAVLMLGTSTFQPTYSRPTKETPELPSEGAPSAPGR